MAWSRSRSMTRRPRDAVAVAEHVLAPDGEVEDVAVGDRQGRVGLQRDRRHPLVEQGEAHRDRAPVEDAGSRLVAAGEAEVGACRREEQRGGGLRGPASGSTTAGSGSRSTITMVAASTPWRSVSATTTATISPVNRTRSTAIGGSAELDRHAGRPGATTGRSRSAAVYTPTTPGIAAACDGSTEMMEACASWARTGTRYTAPSTRWLGMKVPSPLRNRGSSIRFTAAPRIEPATAGI